MTLLQTSGEPMIPDMTFVIGPGRSGTTLLYKLLCMHPEVAYISSIENHLPWLSASLTGRVRVNSYAHKLRYWFLKGGNAYVVKRHLLQKLIPVPVEGERLYRYHGLPAQPERDQEFGIFAGAALRRVFAQLRKVARKTVFISKRTANNRRLPMLDAAFPTASFINLQRDGRDVAASLSAVGWWDNHPLWWEPNHRTPKQAAALGEDKLRLCARNWVAEAEAIENGFETIEPTRVLALQYEDLLAEPLKEMRRVLDFVGLPSSADYEDAITNLRLAARPSTWQTTWTPEQTSMVNYEQKQQLARQGYTT